MIITFFLILLYSSNSFAWINPNVFTSKYINLEQKLLKRTLKSKFNETTSSLEGKTVDYILADKDNRVSDKFSIPKYFNPSVRFWFSIYTQFTSKQVVIHDKDNLDIVYNIIDFSEIHSSDINRYAKAKLQKQLKIEYTKKLKNSLKRLADNFSNLTDEEKGLIDAIQKNHSIPKNSKKRSYFFKKLSLNIRTQTGQRDKIYRGILRAKPYFPLLYKKIEAFKLPKELLAITFLESSFNPKAYSKVGAAGAWQFMPYIASLFMPKRSRYMDYRLNIIISSVAAMHLLKQNKMILKTWDFAIPAYNSGTKHLVKARRKFKNVKNLSLEYILENYKHDHIGFASKNFYSEFLALVHVLAYKNVIYPLKGFQEDKNRFNSDNVKIYIAKCKIKPSYIYKLLDKSSPNFPELNSHFRYPKRRYKRGHFIVSDLKLTDRKYYQLNLDQITSLYPKKWPRLIKSKKCGKRD